jgi:hypothetical protein
MTGHGTRPAGVGKLASRAVRPVLLTPFPPMPHLTRRAMRASVVARPAMANSESRIANGKRTSLLFAIRYSLFALAISVASPAVAIECAPYCDYTHDYGPYDLSWKRPGLYAFPLCAPNGECAPRAAHVYSPVSGWPYYWPYRGVRITVRPRLRSR